jgi:lipoate synthase
MLNDEKGVSGWVMEDLDYRQLSILDFGQYAVGSKSHGTYRRFGHIPF